ncbi:MAG: hypothetical protein MUO77_02405 [Anaerolineales bacterium]|nr:hypothetical protein [Anaerolineales bacterium]
MDPIFLSIICWFCIFPVLFLLFFGVVAGIIYIAHRKNTDAWRDLAQRAGLTFNAPRWPLGRPTLTGSWHGRAHRVYTRTSGAPDTGRTITMCIEMAANLPENSTLSITERNFLSQLGKTGEETRIGDVEFDQRFVTRGQPPEFARRLLESSGLRHLLLQSRYLNLEAAGGQVRYWQLSVETDVEYMLFLMSLLFDVTEAIERV